MEGVSCLWVSCSYSPGRPTSCWASSAFNLKHWQEVLLDSDRKSSTVASDSFIMTQVASPLLHVSTQLSKSGSESVWGTESASETPEPAASTNKQQFQSERESDLLSSAETNGAQLLAELFIHVIYSWKKYSHLLLMSKWQNHSVEILRDALVWL